MATMQDVKAAEEKMNQARDALLAYVERQNAPRDPKRHRELAEALKKATDEYAESVIQLGQ